VGLHTSVSEGIHSDLHLGAVNIPSPQ
ncbi:uncharacterized protein METZ01_LOCUS360242, partial [marine metagenome]